MDQKRTLAVQLLVLASLLAGCSTPRSNTRGLEEHVAVSYFDAPTLSVQNHSIVAGAAIGTAALKLAKQLGAALLRMEAKKYEETWKGGNILTMGGVQFDGAAVPSGFRLQHGGVFLVLRTVQSDVDSSRVLELEQFGPGQQEAEAVVIETELKQYGVEGVGQQVRAAIKKAVPPPEKMKESKTLFLSFAAVILVQPSKEGETFELQLIGYRYNARKAKNLAFKIPFTNYHKAEGALTVQLRGPDQEPFRPAGQFDATVQFKPKWDRKKAKAGDAVDWDWMDDDELDLPRRSGPIAVPSYKDLSVSVVLLETGNLKKALNNLAEEVKDLKVD